VIDATTIHVIVVIFVATLIRSTLGFGEALIAVPFLVLRIVKGGPADHTRLVLFSRQRYTHRQSRLV
jgi:hypothetical protein